MSRFDKLSLFGLLALALAHGLVYVFITPPWQHYDEPNHFEYAWLTAMRGSIPQPGDYDQEMRRAVAQSMIDTGFFEGGGALPDLYPVDGPISIGLYSQLGDPPLYYLLAAVPVRLTAGFDVATQLYAARLFSVLLLVFTVWAAWGVAGELTAPANALRWMLPATLALLPGYVELMTALNSDVAAAACFSGLVWAAARLVRKGFSWTAAGWAMLAVVAGIFCKRTTYPGIALLAIALLFALLRGRLRWLAWATVLVAGVGGTVAVFSWGDAALWVRRPPNSPGALFQTADAPLGSSVFRVTLSPQAPSAKFTQFLPVEAVQGLQGKTVTLGAWVWADKPATLRSPNLFVYEGLRQTFRQIAVTTTPQFFTLTTALEDDSWRAWVILDAAANPADLPLTVFFDGLVLAEGDFSAQPPPVFTGVSGSTGTWGGVEFVNLLRNASGEQTWLAVRPWAEQIGSRLFADAGQDSISLAVYTLLDYPATGWYYRTTARNLVQTFWGKFGWQHVRLPFRWYWVLAGVTLLGVSGTGLVCLRGWRRLDWAVLFWLGLAMAVVWGLAFVRGSNYVFFSGAFTGSARYAFPVIIPTALALAGGWREWGRLAKWAAEKLTDKRLPGWLGAALFWFGFAVLDSVCVATVARYYHLFG